MKNFSEPQHGFCKDNRDSLIPNRECRGQTQAVCKMEEILVTLEDGTDKMLFIERSCNNKRDGKLQFVAYSLDFGGRNKEFIYFRSKNID